ALVLSAPPRYSPARRAARLRFAAVSIAAGAASFYPRGLAPPPVPMLPGGLRPVGWALSELRRHEPAAVLAAASALGRFTSREWIGSLDVPTAVIVHSRDRVVPTNRQRKLAAALLDSSVIE